MAANSTNQRASRILGQTLGGTVVPRDVPGAPPGTHDFDVKLRDGRTVAVEETISTDRRIVQFWHVVHDESWDAPSLRRSWLLNVTPPARVKTLRDRVEPLLRALENAGVDKFGLLPGVTASSPEITELHGLLVKAGGVLPALPPRIFIMHTGAGATSTDAVREAIEQEAMKSDNRSKLVRAVADERHLFVWVDPLGSPAAPATGFMDVALPGGCNLPPEIDVVWVAVPTIDDAGNDGERLWRYDRRSGWQDIGPR